MGTYVRWCQNGGTLQSAWDTDSATFELLDIEGWLKDTGQIKMWESQEENTLNGIKTKFIFLLFPSFLTCCGYF